MNPNVDLIFKYIKKLLIWLVAPLTFVIFIFFLGEQYEVGRLAAIWQVNRIIRILAVVILVRSLEWSVET
jgi:hypothetical protein